MAPRKPLVSDDMIPTLIHEVRSRQCIWNQEDDHYNDRYQVLCAWKEIAKVMDIPEDALKSKWKNLRDLFKRETRKVHFTSLEDYPGHWRYFKAMSFIYKPKDPSTDNYEEVEEETAEAIVKFETQDSEEHEIFLNETDPIPDKRMRYSDDEYDLMYLKSLTPYFSQLDPMRKLVVRSKIQDLLLNELAAQNTQNSVNRNKK